MCPVMIDGGDDDDDDTLLVVVVQCDGTTVERIPHHYMVSHMADLNVECFCAVAVTDRHHGYQERRGEGLKNP